MFSNTSNAFHGTIFPSPLSSPCIYIKTVYNSIISGSQLSNAIHKQTEGFLTFWIKFKSNIKYILQTEIVRIMSDGIK